MHIAYQSCYCYSFFLCFVGLYAGHPYIHLNFFYSFVCALFKITRFASVEFSQKWQELQAEYVPLMANTIERLKKDDLTQSEQYIKLNHLYGLLNGKNRRLGYLLTTEMMCHSQQPGIYKPHVSDQLLPISHFSGYLVQHWKSMNMC